MFIGSLVFLEGAALYSETFKDFPSDSYKWSGEAVMNEGVGLGVDDPNSRSFGDDPRFYCGRGPSFK